MVRDKVVFTEREAEAISRALFSQNHRPQSPPVGILRRSWRAARAAGITVPITTAIGVIFGAGLAVATLYWMGYIDTAKLAQADAEHQLEVLRQEYRHLAVRCEELAEKHEQFKQQVTDRENERQARAERIKGYLKAATENRDLLNALAPALWLAEEILASDPSVQEVADGILDGIRKFMDIVREQRASEEE